MKITEFKLFTYNVKLEKPFKISYAEFTEYRNIILVVYDEKGNLGISEVEEEAEIRKIYNTLERISKESKLTLHKVNYLAYKYSVDNITKCLIINAIFDIYARREGLPLYVYLGEKLDKILSDVTVGLDIPEEMLKEIEYYLNLGYNIIKVKVGRGLKWDLNLIEKVYDRIRGKARVRLDANQGWSFKEAEKILRTIQKLGIVELIEQPLQKDKLGELKKLREISKIPIAVDESVRSIEDMVNIVKHKAADVVNIKVHRVGGLYEALSMAYLALKYNLDIMVGCSLETDIGILHDLAFACGVGAKYADLDSDVLNKVHVLKVRIPFPIRKPLDKPGIGITEEDINWHVLSEVEVK